MRTYHLWDSWPGRGDHEGHTITAIEAWPVRITGATVTFRDGQVVITGGLFTSGRVRCTCGVEWDTTVPYTSLGHTPL